MVARRRVYRGRIARQNLACEIGKDRPWLHRQGIPLARLSMLTTDVAVSPKGALYVCCHSGQPDWGTGPKGEGQIFKITYSDPEAPQPVLPGQSDRTETRIVFDKPIDPSSRTVCWTAVLNWVISFELPIGLEVLKPPYKVVSNRK